MFFSFREGNKFKELSLFHFKELRTIQKQTIPVSDPVKCQNNCFWLLVGVTGSAEISQRDMCNFGRHLQAVVKGNFLLIYNFE